MIKIVPDPPPFNLSITTTAHWPFGILDSNSQPLFAVREGIRAEDALAHAGTLLGSAEATAWDAVDHLGLNDKALVLSVIHNLEMARALLDSVLGGTR